MDIEFSLRGSEIKKFKDDLVFTQDIFKNKKFSRSKDELKSKVFRRSLFAVKDINKGEKFNRNNIKRIRPGHGIEPVYYKKLLGKKSPFKIDKGEPLNKNVLKKLKIKTQP